MKEVVSSLAMLDKSGKVGVNYISQVSGVWNRAAHSIEKVPGR